VTEETSNVDISPEGEVVLPPKDEGSKVPMVEQSKLEELQAQLETVQTESSETIKGLQSQLKQLQSRLDAAQDQLLEVAAGKKIEGEEEKELVPGGTETFDENELSQEGRYVLSVVQKEIQKTRDQMTELAQSARGEVDQAITARQAVADLRREVGDETFELVRPTAVLIADANPELSVREAWDQAMERFKPYLEAAKAQKEAEEKRKEEAARAAKPGGLGGEEEPRTAREAFDRAADELGL